MAFWRQSQNPSQNQASQPKSKPNQASQPSSKPTLQAIVGPGHHTVILNQVSWAERSQQSHSLSWAERSLPSQELSIPRWTLSTKSRTLHSELNALYHSTIYQAERSLQPIFQPTFQLQAFNHHDVPQSTTDPGSAIYQSMVLFFFLKSVTFVFCLVSSSQSIWGRKCHVYYLSIWTSIPQSCFNLTGILSTLFLRAVVFSNSLCFTECLTVSLFRSPWEWDSHYIYILLSSQFAIME